MQTYPSHLKLLLALAINRVDKHLKGPISSETRFRSARGNPNPLTSCATDLLETLLFEAGQLLGSSQRNARVIAFAALLTTS